MKVSSIDIGSATTGINVSRRAAEEEKDHDDNQHERDDERFLHVVNGF